MGIGCDDIMAEEKLAKVKCRKCGFENVKGTFRCIKCKTPLSETKSCPKCARRNKIDAVICSKCGYKFGKKRSIWFNLIISIFLVIILSLMVYFKHVGTVNNISNILKILAAILICGLLYGTVNYGKNDIIKFSAEEEMIDNEKFNLLRKISNIAIIIGTILVVGFLIYYYFIL